MTNNRTVTCQHCKKELPGDHKGPCPSCGSNEILFQISTGDGAVGIEGVLSITEKPKWSSESLALFFGFLAIFLGVVIPSILMLFPFSHGVNFGILVGFLIGTSFIFWRQRYRVLMFIRWVEGRFGGEKTRKAG